MKLRKQRLNGFKLKSFLLNHKILMDCQGHFAITIGQKLSNQQQKLLQHNFTDYKGSNLIIMY